LKLIVHFSEEIAMKKPFANATADPANATNFLDNSISAYMAAIGARPDI